MRSHNSRPTQQQVVRRSWMLVALLALCMVAGVFNHLVWTSVPLIAGTLGFWAGRAEEASLAAKGQGIQIEAPLAPMGRVEWPAESDG